MNKPKAWLTIGAALACIGCCAVPIYIVFSGVSAAGIAVAVWIPQFLEILLCLLPIIILGGLFLHRRRHQTCCITPSEQCQSNQCSTIDKTG